MLSRVMGTALAIPLLVAGSLGLNVGAARAEMPADCTSADAVVSGKIRALMRRSDVRATWLVGNSIAAVKQARAHCAGGQQDMGLRQYARVLLYIESQELAMAAPEPAGEDPVAAAAKQTSEEPDFQPW